MREPQARSGIETIQRRALEPLDACQPGAVRRVQFPLQNDCGLGRRLEQITVQPGKVTVDFFACADGFDAVDRSAMALGGAPRTVFSEQLFQIEITIVESIREVRRGSRCLASG